MQAFRDCFCGNPLFYGNTELYFAVLSVVGDIWGWYSLQYTGGKCYETKKAI